MLNKYKKIFASIILSLILTLIFGGPIWEILFYDNKIIGFLVTFLFFYPLIIIPLLKLKSSTIYLSIILLIGIILSFINNSTVPISYALMGILIGIIASWLVCKKNIKVIFLVIISTLILSIIFNPIFLILYKSIDLKPVGMFWIIIVSTYAYLPFSYIIFPFIAKLAFYAQNNLLFSFFLSLSFFWFLIAYPTLSYFYQKKKLWLKLILPYVVVALLSFWNNYKFYLVSLSLAAVGWFAGWIIIKTGLRQKIASLLQKNYN